MCGHFAGGFPMKVQSEPDCETTLTIYNGGYNGKKSIGLY